MISCILALSATTLTWPCRRCDYH